MRMICSSRIYRRQVSGSGTATLLVHIPRARWMLASLSRLSVVESFELHDVRVTYNAHDLQLAVLYTRQISGSTYPTRSRTYLELNHVRVTYNTHDLRLTVLLTSIQRILLLGIPLYSPVIKKKKNPPRGRAATTHAPVR